MKHAPRFHHFGTHLTLDGYRGNPYKLNNMDLVFKILDRLPTEMGMKKIITPYVVRCPGNNKKDPGGISGFVMIAESHISIHTFPRRRFVSIDLYTCQNAMDHHKALNLFRSAFELEDMEINIIRRGKKFSRLAQPIQFKSQKEKFSPVPSS